MMEIRFIGTYTGPIAPGGKTGPIMRRIMKQVWEEVGVLWQQEMLPKHFTEEGAREYRYQPRTPKYMQRKMREKGHQDPLVFSGRSRFLSKIPDIRPTSKGVRIVIRVPALNFRPKPGAPPMRQELTRMSSNDRRRITRLMSRRSPELINEDKTRTTRQVAA